MKLYFAKDKELNILYEGNNFKTTFTSVANLKRSISYSNRFDDVEDSIKNYNIYVIDLESEKISLA